ncbi:MAG: DUF1801 domain-containing protein [Sphingobacteriales bacterium]|nr:MAG: DUF1801 domain-containing protein [Sphingobacteriales bacterium]
MKKIVEHITADTVDAYIEAQPASVAVVLEKVRKAILKAAPKAEEKIAYQVPSYKYVGYPLVHFAAFKNHLSFFGVSKDMYQHFAKELEPFKLVGSTIHFTVEKPLPSALIQKMVQWRMQQNEALAVAKKAKAK